MSAWWWLLLLWPVLSVVVGLILGPWLRSVSTEYEEELARVEALRIGEGES